MNNTKQQFGKRFQAVRELKHQTRLLLAQIKEATNQFGSTKKKLQAVQVELNTVIKPKSITEG